MKKTLISIFLVALMLITFIVPASAASGSLSANATFSAKTVTVNLVVENNPGIIAMTAHASYDSNVLTLKSAKNGEIFESIFTPSQTLEDNPYKIIWMDATASEDITTNGVLATYTFEVKDTAAEQTEIKFSIAETVNVKSEDTAAFNPCTFKVDLKNMAGESKTESQLPVSSSANTVGTGSKDAVSGDQAVDNGASDNADVSSKVEEVTSKQSEANKEETSLDISDEAESESDIVEKDNDRALVTILTIAIIVVLGGVVTVVAIYFRKKSSAKNEEK